ncbi:MAG: NADH:flavin oxidoreductase [Deltaproteobacteria bacterium]|nr:NADH:flavin oxidoreductase [Deltaproteobacteria bacterium]
MAYPRISSFKTAGEFRAYLAQAGIDLELDDDLQVGAEAPLAQTYRSANGFTIGNRFCILPMEGWDGTADGHPSELTFRRWRRFGASGAKLIWGGEAVAVRHDGRANPNQLLAGEKTLPDLAALREGLIAAHPGKTDDLLIGLQLTHSGRYSKPNDKRRDEPRILYHHPLLDRRLGIGQDDPVLADDEIKRLIDDFIAAADLAKRAGFAFVDIKHCHGYLGHEFLSAVDRPGPYGGAFENRTRFLREISAGIRANVPGLEIGVRVSVFDFIPFRKGAGGVGEPEELSGPYRFAFGGDGRGLGIDLTEPKKFMDLLASLGIRMVCITAGSPYYNPHLTRPAAFPPSDGYQPPEEPLLGVARQVKVTAELKRYRPDLLVVGSAYTYLQEWLPNVAQRVVRAGDADFIGLGRMVLSYPEMCADVLAGRPLQTRLICRTFSDCTTGPRNGLVSGCYPLDTYYGQLPEAGLLRDMKKNRDELLKSYSPMR